MTPEDREGLAHHDGYAEGLQDGRHEGVRQGFILGYKTAWLDARSVANGWGWVKGLPKLHQPPEVPAFPY